MIPLGNSAGDRTLGSAIRALRKEAGLSQTQLALLAGVGRRFVSELERGKKPNLQIGKVEAVLGVFGMRLGVVSDREQGGGD